MEKRIIVTLCFDGREQDFELPAATPLRELEENLASAVSEAFSLAHFDDKLFYLVSETGYLSPELPLREQGITDGARLQIRIFED